MRVARLAAQGLRNREIAETLVVTGKTVDYHLRHVYQKLGGSRQDLGAAFEQDVREAREARSRGRSVVLVGLVAWGGRQRSARRPFPTGRS